MENSSSHWVVSIQFQRPQSWRTLPAIQKCPFSISMLTPIYEWNILARHTATLASWRASPILDFQWTEWSKLAFERRKKPNLNMQRSWAFKHSMQREFEK